MKTVILLSILLCSIFTFGQCDAPATNHWIFPDTTDVFSNEPTNCFENYNTPGLWYNVKVKFTATSNTAVLALKPGWTEYSVQGYLFQFWILTDSVCDTVTTAVLDDTWIMPYTNEAAYYYGQKVTKYTGLTIGKTYYASIKHFISPAPTNVEIGNLCVAYYSEGEHYLEVDEIPLPKKILSYPNPANSFVNFHIPEGFTTIIVNDIKGRIIDKIILDPIQKSIQINTSDYTNGLYIFTFSGSRNSYIINKVLIQH